MISVWPVAAALPGIANRPAIIPERRESVVTLSSVGYLILHRVCFLSI